MIFQGFPTVPKNFKWEKDELRTQVVLKKKFIFGWKEVARENVRGVLSLPASDKLYSLTAGVVWKIYKEIHTNDL